MTAGRLRGLAQNLGLLAAASLFAVAGAEWVLRTWLPQAGFVYRLDPRSLYALAPGGRKLYRNSEANGGRRSAVDAALHGKRADCGASSACHAGLRLASANAITSGGDIRKPRSMSVAPPRCARPATHETGV